VTVRCSKSIVLDFLDAFCSLPLSHLLSHMSIGIWTSGSLPHLQTKPRSVCMSPYFVPSPHHLAITHGAKHSRKSQKNKADPKRSGCDAKIPSNKSKKTKKTKIFIKMPPAVALVIVPDSLNILVFLVFLDFFEGILASHPGRFGSALVFLDFLDAFSNSLFGPL
jgi:hypothetical protein